MLRTNRLIQGLLVTAVTVLAFGALASVAGAVPASKLAQAREVKRQIDALDHKMGVASEDYNDAAIELDKATKKRQKVEKRLEENAARMGELRASLNDRASAMYRQGPAGFIEVLLGAESFEDFAVVWDMLSTMNESDAASLDELEELQREAKALRKELAAEEKVAKDAAKVMKAKKDSIEAQLRERQRKLRGLESEIAALEAAEERARAAAAPSTSGGGNWPAPTRAPRSQVVSIAKQYIGVPYRWAGSSPSSGFDCSGYTMYVFRQVGVKLPHSSRAQIHYGERVSRGDLKPGDLVFFGSPIHHVGIYVGGNQYIHAPHTGARVRIDSMNRSGYAGASRP